MSKKDRFAKEKAALTTKYAHLPHETCSSCGESFPISESSEPDSSDISWRKSALVPTVAYVADLYNWNLPDGQQGFSWMCYACCEKR